MQTKKSGGHSPLKLHQLFGVRLLSGIFGKRNA